MCYMFVYLFFYMLHGISMLLAEAMPASMRGSSILAGLQLADNFLIHCLYKNDDLRGFPTLMYTV